MAELSGRTPAEVIADVNADFGEESGTTSNWQQRTFLNMGGGDGWQLADDIDVVWTGKVNGKLQLMFFGIWVLLSCLR